MSLENELTLVASLCPEPSARDSICRSFCRNYLRFHKVTPDDLDENWKQYVHSIYAEVQVSLYPEAFCLSEATDGVWNIIGTWKAHKRKQNTAGNRKNETHESAGKNVKSELCLFATKVGLDCNCFHLM